MSFIAKIVSQCTFNKYIATITMIKHHHKNQHKYHKQSISKRS